MSSTTNGAGLKATSSGRGAAPVAVTLGRKPLAEGFVDGGGVVVSPGAG